MLTAGAGGLSTVEEEMQLVMWALFNSPLIMSNDLPNIDVASKQLLLNKVRVLFDTQQYCRTLRISTSLKYLISDVGRKG
jgi:hypothetical protein